MEIKNISISKTETGIYKKYQVAYKSKTDIIYYSQDDWGLRFEPYAGTFTKKEFDEVCKNLFDDAYYHLNFSKF